MVSFKAKAQIGGMVLVLLVCGVLGYYWRHQSTSEASAGGPLLEAAPVSLAPGIYLLGDLYPSAAYAVDTSEGLVLIDTSSEPEAGRLMRQLTTLGLDVQRLHTILLTHAHFDHIAGARFLRKLIGAKVYAGRGDCEVLRAGGPSEALFTTFSTTGQEIHPTPVDVELSGDEVITVGEARFHVLATPGHTPGSTCYLLERNGLRALFAGDMIMSLTNWSPYGGLGRYSSYLSPRYRGNAKDFLASLRKLAALPVPDLVLPGHPRSDRSSQSPRLTQEQWQAFLDEGIAEMETLVKRYARDGANFIDGTPKQLLPGLYYLGDHGGSPIYALINAEKKLFVFDAPGDEQLPSWLEKRLAAVGAEPIKPTAVVLTSCGPEATGGLRSLVEKSGCKVIAPDTGIESVKKLCPPATRVDPATSLEKTTWFPVEVVPLEGLDSPAAAYKLTWAGKTVLISGRMPIKMTFEAISQLKRSPSTENIGKHVRSLDKLSKITPDLWLPAVPVLKPNANLYGSEWADVIKVNKGFVEQGLLVR